MRNALPLCAHGFNPCAHIAMRRRNKVVDIAPRRDNTARLFPALL
jgi:hypothetical protein